MKNAAANSTKRHKITRSLRLFRKIHRTTGIFLFLVMMLVGATGLLLGWKKNSFGKIHPSTYKGSSTDLSEWLPMDTLQLIAFTALKKEKGDDINLDIQRIDARPNKGTVKFIFSDHYNGVQVDASTGDILKITRRNSDIIENLHDGSLLDRLLGTKGEVIKLVFTSISGLSLILFSVSGFWLWYGPKLVRKNRN